MTLDESIPAIWVGGDDNFDLTQIDLNTGTVIGNVDYGTEGLEELSPQKLIIDSGVLYFIPELTSAGFRHRLALIPL